MQTMQFEIQFIGKQCDAVQILSRYFNGDAIDGSIVRDSFDREWVVKQHADGKRSILVTPQLYLFSDATESVVMHDILLLFRMSAAFTFDGNCGMSIIVPAPADKRKLGLYYEMYVENQFDQVDDFSVTVAGPLGEARLYEYGVCGFEIDDIKDILLIITANYNADASDFALDFSRVLSDDVLAFKAFNGSFDDEYVLSAASWVHDFVKCCENLWQEGYKATYEHLRTIY